MMEPGLEQGFLSLCPMCFHYPACSEIPTLVIITEVKEVKVTPKIYFDFFFYLMIQIQLPLASSAIVYRHMASGTEKLKFYFCLT